MISFVDTNKIYKDVCARLCTMDELLAGEGEGSGCMPNVTMAKTCTQYTFRVNKPGHETITIKVGWQSSQVLLRDLQSNPKDDHRKSALLCLLF